jgi:hypothetical protein
MNRLVMVELMHPLASSLLGSTGVVITCNSIPLHMT